ncbi:unnamed protein product, partial [Adineta steineri]
MDSSNCLTPSLTIENDLDPPDGDDDDFKRILFPIISTNISPLGT